MTVSAIRHTDLILAYNDYPTDKIGTIESFSYIDVAHNNSDSISITFDNIDDRWQNGWMPKLNDKIQARIAWHNVVGEHIGFVCGEFVVDDFTISRPPAICSINATSTPTQTSFKVEPKTKTWQKVTVKQIATEIATNSQMELVFDADDTAAIEKIEQSFETDSAFLSKVCSDHALQLKVYSTKIIIYDEAKYEDKPEVAIITPKNCKNWQYNNSILGTYTGAKLSYTNSKKNQTFNVQVGIPDRLLYINETVENEAEAEKKAYAKLNEANRSLITASVTLNEPRVLIASTTVKLKDFMGGIDGKYFITKVSHSIESSGYEVSVELRRVIPKISKESVANNNNNNSNSKNTEGQQHTISGADNLWALAKKYYGKGELMSKIYEANKDVIESVAKSHGKSSSDKGHWVYDGTVLTIPPL